MFGNFNSEIESLRSAVADAEHRAHGSFAMLHSVLNSLHEGLVIVDEDGIITVTNEAAQRLFNYTESELIGQNVSILIPEPYRSLHVARFKEYVRTGKAHILGTTREFQGLRKDGSVFPIKVTVTETWSLDGRLFSGLLCAVADEQKSDEQIVHEALRQESEARMRQMCHSMPLIVWTCLPDGHPEFVNDRWLEYTHAAKQADHLRIWKQSLHEDDAPTAIRGWEEAVLTAQPFQIQYRMRRYDGEYRWFQSRSVPIKDSHGNVIRWLRTINDIHDSKMAEQALLDSDRRKNDFLALLGHELRNPLAPIRFAIEVLRQRVTNDPELFRITEIVERQTLHLARIVDDLLDIARVSHSKLEIHPWPLDVVELVRDAVADQRPGIETKGLALSLQLPDQPVIVRADPTRLAQVVFNLLHNAVKFTSHGGTISIDIRVIENGTRASISIADTGAGIAPEMLSKIFEPFTQIVADGRAKSGLGLGLALVKGLVELHCGTVHVESKGVGQGSKFVVTLPTSRDEIAKQSHDLHVKSSAPKRVLVVDDDLEAADCLRMLLASEGHEVVAEHDGHAAIQAARQFRPEIVFTDLNLRGEMDGYSIARTLRSEHGVKKLFLVALTGYGDEIHRTLAREAGFDEYLLKPPVLSAINNLLAREAPR